MPHLFSLARLAVGAALLALPACRSKTDEAAATTPAQVTFTQAGLYPEGTQYDGRNGRFLVGSQTAGRIGTVTDGGTYAQLADDPVLVSSIGLHLDATRNRLLVAISDPGYNAARTSAATKGKLAALAAFDPSTGARLGYANLGNLRPNAPGHFANDAAVDAQGNVYVTDSFAPLIYKLDGQYGATVLLENTALAAPAGAFGLNGIACHPGGYLLVAKSDEGALFKVPLASPATFTRVTLPAGLDLRGVDGLHLYDDNTLLAVCNAQGRVYRLGSADGFVSTSSTGSFATGAVYPTTLARRDNDVFVLYSRLDALQRMQTPPVADFTLTKVQF